MQNRQPINKSEEKGIIQIAAGCGDAHVRMDAGKGKGYLGKILPMVDVRTGPYKEEPREPLESLKGRVQKAVDRAMDCVGKRAYDSTLMDEMYAIQKDGRLEGMTVKRSGVEIDATRAICEMQECMLRLIGPVHPW